MFWDYTYILVLIGAAISAVASWNVNRSFSKYSKVYSHKGITAEQCAEYILRQAGITDVRIDRIKGSLTDHYSPSEKILRLSDSVYGSNSVAAIGVAAHECGHAIQHSTGYFPLHLRSISVPVANIGSKLSWPIVIIGIILGYTPLANIGVIMFLAVVLFQLITLPVEFNASRRAIKILDESNMLVDDELKSAKKVLKSAALTYVAALFSTVLQLLRLVLIVKGNDRSRRR